MQLPANNFPIFLDNPRAWRTYLGGRQLDALHGDPNGTDGHFPEEWILSTVAARNAGREDLPEEGMCHLRGSSLTLAALLAQAPQQYLGAQHVRALSASLGVLVKLIDSAERLTLQVHPDRQTARALFHSSFGKTECWHILSGRTVHGEPPCIYLGFREGVTRSAWKDLFDRQDIAGMLNAVQKYEVSPGDTILIEGGMPHAIGAGCLLVEIQEPTDYTIRVERTTPSGFAVADSMCHQGVGFDRMFDCFHYEPLSRAEIHDRWFIPPKALSDQSGGRITNLIGYDTTPLFRLDELTVTGALTVPASADCSGLYVLEGAGTLSAGGKTAPLKKTDQLFVPCAVGAFTLKSDPGTPLRVLHFFGPSLG
jgi:mannose-6-phosphate isomerase